MSEMYSQLKPLWHLDRLVQLREGRRPAPVHVQLILSDLCNQDCSFCAYRMSAGLSTELFGTPETHNPNRRMRTEKALEIVEDCAAMGVRAIQFTGGGEPTVHPDHLLIMGRAQELGMQTGLVTNGVRLNPAAREIQGMTWIRVSVDAGTPETYAAVRHVPRGHWSRAWNNIAGLREHGYAGTLGVGFVVTPANFAGVESCGVLAKMSGASYLRAGAVFSADGTAFYGERIHEIARVVAEAKAALDDESFEVVDLFGRRIGDLEEGRPEDPECGYQYLTAYVGADLNVYRCCNTAYTRAGVVGSLAGQRLRDAALAYEPFDARTCRHCQFLGQNRAIRATTRQPQHVDFV